jgi:hypothetical protein
MKKTNKKQNKQTAPKIKVVKDLAQQFEADLNKALPIAVQPDGSIVYKGYVIRLTKNGAWGIYHISNKDLVEQFFLKTSAIMAAKAYDKVQLERFFEIKRLDNGYWSNYCDTLVYGKNIKTAKDLDRYIILLNKLEYSTSLSEHYKEKISQMFKWSFV